MPEFKKPHALTDVPFHYCPGCTHGIVHRLVAEVIDEMGIEGETIGVCPVGCSVMAYDYFSCDMIEAAHGRAPAVATGVKRGNPDKFVFTYQGDGDLAAIGTAETVHAATRGENITVIFINNTTYGMTGGQMAPTTLPGQVTQTTPYGRNPDVEGFPVRVCALSGPDGYIYDEEGVSSSEEKVNYLLEMRASGRNRVQDYADKFGVPFFPGEKPWGVKADVIMPSAMQNDVNMESAQKIVANGVKYYIEVANMPTTNDALYYLMSQKNMVVAPSKAVNAGGVGVSALEMSQNSERLVWTAEEVDAQLHKMMVNIHKVSAEAAEEYGLGYDLVAGANIAGFKKVAEAMMEQGCF